MSDPHTQRIRNASQDPDWRTPPALVSALRRVFPFTIDLAADRASNVVARLPLPLETTTYLGPGRGAPLEDGLQVGWAGSQHTVGFLNPPYSLAKIKALRFEQAQRKENGAKGAVLEEYNHRIKALRIESWAQKAYEESLQGFTTIGVFPYAPQTKWFRRYVLGHLKNPEYPSMREGWSGHAALDCWVLAHRVTFLRPDGSAAANANVNSCIIHWGPNPGFQGPWVPSFRSWSYR